MVNIVKCPHCEGELYRTGPMQDGGNGLIGKPPKIEQAGGTHFMKCPHCSKPARLRVVQGGPSGSNFELDQ